MKISCEKCGQSYEVDASRIPAAGLTMKCTRCLHSFAVRPSSEAPEQAGTELDLSGAGEDAGPLVPPPPDFGAAPSAIVAPAPSAGLKYYVRRPTGKVFGPFPKPAIDEMLLQHKLSGNEEISTDGEHWQPITALDDMQRAADADADLPVPKGAPPAVEEIADLPGLPERTKSADLPAPKTSTADEVPGILRGPASLHAVPVVAGGTAQGHQREPAPGAPTGKAGEFDLGDFEPPIGGLPDLPAPKGALPRPDLADLPAPKGAAPQAHPGEFDLRDLPAPKSHAAPAGPGFVDLPAPKSPVGDLPAPKSPAGDLPAPKSPAGDLPPLMHATPQNGGVPGMAPTSRAATPPPAASAPAARDSADVLPTDVSFSPPPAAEPREVVPKTGMDYGVVDFEEDEADDGVLSDLPLSPPAGEGREVSPFDLPPPGGEALGASPFDLPPPGGGTPGASPFDLPPPGGGTPGGEAAPFSFDLPPPGVGEAEGGVAQIVSPKPGAEPLSAESFAPPGADVEPEAKPAAAPREAAAPAPRADPPPKAEPAEEPKTAPAAAPAPRRSGLSLPESRGARIGIGAGLLVILAGLALGFTDLGFFGLNVLTGGSDPDKPGGGGGPLLAKGITALGRDTFKGYTDAAEAFSTASVASPEDSDAKALHAQALAALVVRFGHRQHLATMQQLTSGLAAQPEPTAEVNKARGLALLAEGKAEEAAGQLQSLSNSAPADVQAAVYLGWAQLARDQLQAAKSAFRRALSAKADAVAAILGTAQADLRAKNAAHAAVQVKAGLAIAPAHAGLLLLLGDLALQDNKADEARAAWERVAVQQPPLAAVSEIVAAHNKLGALAAAAGENDRAKQSFEAALKLNAGDSTANIGVGKLLFAAGQYKLALQRFQRGQAAGDPAATVMTARTQLAMGNALHARTALEELIKQQPQNAEVRFLLGLSAEKSNDVEGAIKHYTEAIKRKGDYFDPYRQLSRVYLAQKKTADAFAALQQAATALPRSAPVRNALGEAHMAVDEIDKALIFFEEALAIDPQLNEAAFNLGSALYEKSKQKGLPAEEATKLASKGLARLKDLAQRDPRHPGLAARLGSIFVQQKEYEEAVKAYDLALEIDNPPEELRLAAASAYNRAGAFSKSVQQTEIVSQLRPTMADARALRAEARLGQGQLGEALVEIQQALQREHKSFYYEVQGRILEQMKRFAEAIDSFGEAIRLSPERTDLRLWRGKLLVKRGAVKDGMKEMRAVLKANPEMAEPYLYIGIALADLGKEAEAARSFEQAIAKDPTLAEAHLRLGQMHNDQRRFAKALFHLRLAVKHGQPKAAWRGEALYLLGTVARNLGEKKQAIDALQEFLQVARADDGMRPDAVKALTELGVKPAAKSPP